MRFVREQFYLAATAQNLKRLVRFLSGNGFWVIWRFIVPRP
jgi:hypothetical protein